MSRTPGTIHCDLCQAAIPHESRAVKITVPLTEDLRNAIVEQATKHLPPGILRIAPVMAFVPSHWTLETCGCVLQILPMVPSLVAEDVRRTIERQQAHVQPAPVGSLDDL